MSNVSRRKPAADLKRKKPTMVYGGVKKTYDSYMKEELEVPTKVDRAYKKLTTFLARVDVRKHPIKRTVKTIIRQRVLNPDSSKLEEFVTYTEDWEGVNFFEQDVPPVRSHLEGVWARQRVQPVIGDTSHEIEGWRRTGEDIIYDIKFNKANVDKIIASSAVQEPELILFIIKGPNDRTGYTSYETFVNTEWEKAVDIMMTEGGFEGQHVKEILQRAT